MTNHPTQQDLQPSDGSGDLIAETRSLRRRVEFWQRAVWLIVGAVVIVATVIWQRGEIRRRECYQSLESYAEEASRRRLSEQHPTIFEQQWQNLEKGQAKFSPFHYDLIVENWRINAKPGEVLPLAVCRDSHLLMFMQGRNVLLRDAEAVRVEWRSELAAAEIVAKAAADNRSR